MALKRRTRTARRAAAGTGALRGPELASETVAAREKAALAPEHRRFGKDQKVFLPSTRWAAVPGLVLHHFTHARVLSACLFISVSLGQEPRPSRHQAEAIGNRQTPST